MHVNEGEKCRLSHNDMIFFKHLDNDLWLREIMSIVTIRI